MELAAQLCATKHRYATNEICRRLRKIRCLGSHNCIATTIYLYMETSLQQKKVFIDTCSNLITLIEMVN